MKTKKPRKTIFERALKTNVFYHKKVIYRSQFTCPHCGHMFVGDLDTKILAFQCCKCFCAIIPCYKGGGQGHIKEPRGTESPVRKILKALYNTRDYENLENRLGPQLGDLVKLVISHCDRMEAEEVSRGKS